MLGDRAIDLLVPAAGRAKTQTLGNRAFDSAPGLLLALAADAIDVSVSARLTSGEAIEFDVPVPDIEAAFVLKVLARTTRSSDNDATDIGTLIEIVDATTTFVATPWTLNDSDVVRYGQRGDAAREVSRILSGRGNDFSARTRALLSKHVAQVS